MSASTAGRTSAKLSITPSPIYSAAQLDAYAGNDWLSNGGDLKDDRYSTLTQIGPSNVSKLKLAWKINLGECVAVVPVGPVGGAGGGGGVDQGAGGGAGATTTSCPGQEENAVVADGVMYLGTSKSQVFAIDATNGTILWHYVPTFDPGFNLGTGGRQPGVSIGQGLVFLGQRDGKVVALRQTNGSVAWVASAGLWQRGIRLSETPMYFNGEVIEGNSGGDGGSVSNAMMAFNATTGALLWSWNVIPAHNQPGGNTWPYSGTGSNYGGGAMWENPAIDAKNNLVVFGTGNPVPWNSRGPGANYWTDSIVALDTSTGQLKWAYQTVHHDLWDSDLPNGPVMFDMNVNGKTVPAVADVAKFGWTWVLNRVTGKPLTPVAQVKVPQSKSPDVNTAPIQPIPQTPNTLSGCIAGHCYDQPLKNGQGRLCSDPTRWQGYTAPDGKPVKVSCFFEPYDTTQFVAAPFESMDWPSSSYSPVTQSFISCGVTNRSYAKEQIPASSQIYGAAGGIGSGIISVADSNLDTLNLNDFGNFSSLNLATVSPSSGGKWAWHQIWQAPCYSGSFNTASGLTFIGHLGQGDAKNGLGYLAAVDTKTGAELWQSPLMDAPAAAPGVTYSVNGTQYVSIVAGGESHNDPTRPNPAIPSQRVRGDSVYAYVLPAGTPADHAATPSITGAAPAAQQPAATTPKVTTIAVTAGKPSELAFKLSKTSSIPAGKVTFEVTNDGKIPHDFEICLTASTAAPNACTGGKGQKTPMIQPGKSATLTVTLTKSGEYEFLCTVPGHASSGMKGLIGIGVTVKAPAPTTTTKATTTTATPTTTTKSGGGKSNADGCPAGQTIQSLGADDHDDDDSGGPSDGDGCV